jgi:glycosyltransferase involved in cell wall biosynthesis
MRIAQIAPLAETVPPKLYGGTERVVSWLVNELARRGHAITVFASAGSEVPCTLVPFLPGPLRQAGLRDHTASLLAMLEQVRRRTDEFDVLHFHIDLLQFPMFQQHAHKCLTTLHGRLDLPDFHPIFRTFPEMPLVSISNAQRGDMPSGANWLGTVYHGLPEKLYPFNPRPGSYLAFLGRIAPEKRPDRAIEIAKRAGLPLKIAAKVDSVDAAYFTHEIEPLLNHPLIEFVGEIDDGRKAEFLGNALALLFPIDWPEPFGLVMIEAMCAGTPVIAWRKGSVPEVVDNGVTGYVVDSIDEALFATEQVRHLSRAAVRWRFLERFSASRMAYDYIEVYEALLARRSDGATKASQRRCSAEIAIAAD